MTPDDGRGDGGACLRCGYDLTGLDDRRPCPECGLLAGLSRMSGEHLKDNHPRWLRRLAAGCISLVVALIASPVSAGGVMLLVIWYLRYRQGGFFVSPDDPTILHGLVAVADTVGRPAHLVMGVALVFGPVLLGAEGAWLLSSRSGRAADDRVARPRRWAVRAAAALMAVSAGFVAASYTGAVPGWLMRVEYAILVSSATMLAAVGLLSAAVARSLRPLARRAPAPLLAADSPIVGYTLAACLALPAALMLVETSVGLPDGSGGPFSDLFIVFIAVAGATAATSFIWSIYLLVRYTFAFAKTARQARIAFAAADATVAA